MPQGKRTCKKLIDGKECGHLNGLKADECEKCGNRFPKKKKTKSHKMPTAEQWQNIRCANHALTTAVTSGAVSLDGAHLNDNSITPKVKVKMTEEKMTQGIPPRLFVPKGRVR